MEAATHSESALHTYEPLSGPNFIRLLRLEPALDHDAPLRFSFQQGLHSELEGQYEAISYTWGEPNRVYPLYLDDGTHLLVTQNLDQALRRLRHHQNQRVLWADAACINQNDDKEKESQIPLMVDVFRGASRVLAWLGLESGNTDEQKGMQLLEHFSRVRRPTVQPRNADGDPVWRRQVGVELQSRIKHISGFLNLPWFRRLWIIQEVVFNPDVVLIYGTSEISWARLAAAMSILWKAIELHPRIVRPQRIGALQRITDLWRHHCIDAGHGAGDDKRRELDEDLLELVQEFSDYGCSDARDRIFALCSMAPVIRNYRLTKYAVSPSFEAELHVKIDYSLDILQTYQAFATACVANARAKVILNAMLSRQHCPLADDWPSWVPDWRIPPRKLLWSEPMVLPHGQLSGATVELSIRGHHDFDFLRNSRAFIDAKVPILNQVNRDELLIQLYKTVYIDDHDYSLAHVLSMLKDMLNDMLKDRLKIRMKDRLLPLRTPHSLPWLDEFESHITQSLVTSITQDQNVNEPLQQILQGQCFFSAYIRGSLTRFLGYGNTALAIGDRLIPFQTSQSIESESSYKTKYCLIFRPMPNIADSGLKSEESYRLVGTACLFSSFSKRQSTEREGFSQVNIRLV